MSKRIAIEFVSSTSDVIRGIKLANAGASRVLLVHSLGADLDEFGHTSNAPKKIANYLEPSGFLLPAMIFPITINRSS